MPPGVFSGLRSGRAGAKTAFVFPILTGHGFGLAICRRTVEDHSGTIKSPRRGTAFTLTLPQREGGIPGMRRACTPCWRVPMTAMTSSRYLLCSRTYEEARAEAREILKIDPHFSLEQYTLRLPFKDQAVNECLLTSLRKAGLLE
jgi:hypothetical protein